MSYLAAEAASKQAISWAKEEGPGHEAASCSSTGSSRIFDSLGIQIAQVL